VNAEAPATAPTSARLDQIVAAARDLLEREGPDGLTMRRLAGRLGMQAPSLYKHVADKDELEVLLIEWALRDQGAATHEAVDGLPRGGSKRRALEALARAYRGWALAHPHLYRLATQGPLPRERLPEGLEAWAAEPVVRVAGSEAKARATWAFAHGMTILELDARFPPSADLDAAWKAGIAALV
jgi:AcrR family transcriptional regulator